MTIESLNLNEFETIVLESFIAQLYAEVGFSDVEERDIVKSTKLPEVVVHGSLIGLIQKGIVRAENINDTTLIHLNEEYWGLHTRWSVEMEWTK
jgi:hypothetical protein